MAQDRVATAIVTVKADTDPAKKDIDNLGKDIKQKTGGIEKDFLAMGKKFAGALGIALGAKAFLDFGKSCIDLGSDLAEVQNVVDVVFPHMNDEVNKWAQNASAQFGLSETMAKRYVGTFGSMAEAFGFAEGEALKMAETLTGLSGDVASFYNISQDEAYTKLKSVFSGETETLKELGIVMTQSALDQYALANGIGKTTSAMSEAEKVSLRYKFVQDQLTNSAGDFARTSNSWANQVRLLSLQFNSLRASIGQGLISILTPVIKGLNILLAKIVQVANAFASFMSLFGAKKKSTGIGQTAKETNSLSQGLNNVGSAGVGASKGLKKANKSAKQLQRTLAGFDQITKLDKTSTSAGGGGGGGGGGGIGGGSFGYDDLAESSKKSGIDLAKKYPALAKSLKNLHKATKPLINLLKSAGKYIIDNVFKPLSKWVIDKLAPAFIDKYTASIKAITSGLEAISPILKAVFEIVKPFAELLGDAIIMGLENTTKMLNALSEAFKAVTPYIESASNAVIEKWQNAVSGIKEVVLSIKGKFDDTKESLQAKWNTLVSGIKDIALSIKAKFADTKDTITTAWSNLTSNLKDVTKYAYLKIGSTWKGLKNTWNNLLDKFKGKTATVTLNLKATVSSIKSWINSSIIGKLNTQLHKVPLFKKISIPKLAQGAFVQANTPQLAMIGDNRHQGEVVAPENKLEAMARQVANEVGNGDMGQVVVLLEQIVKLLAGLNLSATVSGNDLANLVVKVINQKTKSTGKSPLYI